MKFTITGKIVSRTYRTITMEGVSPYDLYSIVVEEPGLYPSRFCLSTKDASMLGQSDGPFAVGAAVTASGFMHGTERPAKTRDGKPFTAYNVSFTMTKIEPATLAAQSERPKSNGESIADDIPF